MQIFPITYPDCTATPCGCGGVFEGCDDAADHPTGGIHMYRYIDFHSIGGDYRYAKTYFSIFNAGIPTRTWRHFTVGTAIWNATKAPFGLQVKCSYRSDYYPTPPYGPFWDGPFGSSGYTHEDLPASLSAAMIAGTKTSVEAVVIDAVDYYLVHTSITESAYLLFQEYARSFASSSWNTSLQVSSNTQIISNGTLASEGILPASVSSHFDDEIIFDDNVGREQMFSWSGNPYGAYDNDVAFGVEDTSDFKLRTDPGYLLPQFTCSKLLKADGTTFLWQNTTNW